MIYEKLKELRLYHSYSQQELADKLNVPLKTVKNWESGMEVPTVDNLTVLAEIFGVTVDFFCRDEDNETVNSYNIYKKIHPNYEELVSWEYWSKDLLIEYRQCLDEGKDIEKYGDLFKALNGLPFTPEKERMCDALYDLIQKLPMRQDYPYVEPNTLEAIRAQRSEYKTELKLRNVEDSILGGWIGRLCGCLLGKPVEGIRADQLKTMCEMSNNYPLSRYLTKEEVVPEIQNTVRFWFCNIYPSTLDYMPADDDTNYMLIALRVLERFGRDFTSEDVARIWLECQPKGGYCTAERIAYKNFINGYNPPDSGEYKNAFREWIGAQIRADVFGYINPCNAEAAAEMAWRDARISHVKNGIYGEMWVAAMLATAYGTDSILDIIRAGLAQIPKKSRLHEAVEKICTEYEHGRSADDTFKDIASRWNEIDNYDWCHTVSNAEIVSACLLYGGGDYGKSICLAVSQGFDTDCNGATVGSVLGVMLGYDKLPHEQWTDIIHDTLYTTLLAQDKVSIRESAKKCMEFIGPVK